MVIFNSAYSSLAKLLQNSLPLSDTNSNGVPNLQIHDSKMCLATVVASLLFYVFTIKFIINFIFHFECQHITYRYIYKEKNSYLRKKSYFAEFE